MIDLLLRGARVVGEPAPRDLGVDGGRLVPAGEAREVLDLGGRLVTPPLVEPHIHLDAALTVGQPRPNVSGSLFEGIAVWAERVRDLDLQRVAFRQQGIESCDGGRELMRRAVELGADVVGGIPHFELTREDGVASVRFAFALAEEYGRRVDIHCDETDDDHSRFVEVMVAETLRRGMSGRVTASHTTAMHSYNNAYAHRLVANIARAGLHMVTNPLDNAVLQGRFDTGPVRRGHTRVKLLQEAGVNVCVGHDSVMDPWYPLGYGDPVQAAFVLAHLGHLTGDAELRRLLDMITVNPALALGLADYGLREGGPADLVVFDAPGEVDALRLVAPRYLVLRAGRVVAWTRPAEHVVVWDGVEEPVTFLR